MRRTIFRTLVLFQIEVFIIGWILIKHIDNQEQLLNAINNALVKPVVQCSPANLATPKITIQLDENRRMTGVCVGACK